MNSSFTLHFPLFCNDKECKDVDIVYIKLNIITKTILYITIQWRKYVYYCKYVIFQFIHMNLVTFQYGILNYKMKTLQYIGPSTYHIRNHKCTRDIGKRLYDAHII